MQVIHQTVTDQFSLYHGDCVEVVRGLPDSSVHMAEITREELGATRRDFTSYEPGTEMRVPSWLESGP